MESRDANPRRTRPRVGIGGRVFVHGTDRVVFLAWKLRESIKPSHQHGGAVRKPTGRHSNVGRRSNAVVRGRTDTELDDQARDEHRQAELHRSRYTYWPSCVMFPIESARRQRNKYTTYSRTAPRTRFEIVRFEISPALESTVNTAQVRVE